MTYMVDIKEVSYGYIEVEAESAEEAEKLAHQGYDSGNVFWNKFEYELTKIKPERKKDRGEAR